MRSWIVLVTFIVFYIWAFWFIPPLSAFAGVPFPLSARIFTLYTVGAVPLAACLWLLRKYVTDSDGPGSFRDPLGLAPKGFIPGLVFAACATLPMFVGYGLTGTLNRGVSADFVLMSAGLCGLCEEIFYRAFLFGLLFRYCRWGFLPAVLINAVIFGIGHLYQGGTPIAALGAFGITFAGAVLYSWVYAEWRYNLWTVVWLHILMNLSWIVFTVSSGAAGNLSANIVRAIALILTIGLTVWYKRRTRDPYRVTGRTLLVNRG